MGDARPHAEQGAEVEPSPAAPSSRHTAYHPGSCALYISKLYYDTYDVIIIEKLKRTDQYIGHTPVALCTSFLRRSQGLDRYLPRKTRLWRPQLYLSWCWLLLRHLNVRVCQRSNIRYLEKA
jgi:hypothetical protein